MIYIREAHPTDEWQLPSNEEERVLLAQPTEFSEREAAASACALGLGLTIPTLVDGMDNRAATLYNAWPERLYVLSRDGRVAYNGGKGPYSFDPEELDRFLRSER